MVRLYYDPNDLTLLAVGSKVTETLLVICSIAFGDSGISGNSVFSLTSPLCKLGVN